MAELGSTNIYGNLNITGEVSGELVGDQADEITDNTTHSTGDGSDHADVVDNTSHAIGSGSDHTAVATNTTHRSSNGSDHSIVGTNTTAIGLNTTHRGSDGSDHSGLIPNSDIETGSGTFDTTPGVADTIAHSFGVTSFRVMITPSSDSGGYLGEFWATKTTSNFSVYKTGSGASITFDYILIKD